MAAPDIVVNLDEKFAAFDQHWSPKIIGELNDLHLKAVKVQGEFVWHAHEDSDELFMVRSGTLKISIRDRGEVLVGPGEFFIVPRGIEHRPSAENECEILLLEPIGVVNTGGVSDSQLTAQDEWI